MSNFYGYESESQMREHNPRLADWLIANSEKTATRVSTRGKQCTGSIDGKTFMYSDGSTDEGQTVVAHKAEIRGVVFKWTSTVCDSFVECELEKIKRTGPIPRYIQ